MFGIPTSTFLAFGLLGAIWVVGLWKSVQFAFPDGSTAKVDVSRKVLFHLAALLAAAGPVHTFLNGPSIFSLRIWVGGIVILSGIWAYWYFRVYGWSDILFEHGNSGSSLAKRIVGSPGFMAVPNWVFNNPILFLVGLAFTLTGLSLSAVYWQLSFLSFAGYGIIYLFAVWVYNRLDIVKVWDTHLEYRNGFSSGTPTQIPLAEIKSVEHSSSGSQKRFGVSTVEIGTERVPLRIAMRDVGEFVAALPPAGIVRTPGQGHS